MTTIHTRRIVNKNAHKENNTKWRKYCIQFLIFFPPYCTRAFYPSSSLLTTLPSIIYQSRCTAQNSWWWAERLPETCTVVIPIKVELSASVGFIQFNLAGVFHLSTKIETLCIPKIPHCCHWTNSLCMLQRVSHESVVHQVRFKHLYINYWNPRRRWQDNIKMDLQEMGCGGMDWMEPAQNRDKWRALVNAVMNLRVQ